MAVSLVTNGCKGSDKRITNTFSRHSCPCFQRPGVDLEGVLQRTERIQALINAFVNGFGSPKMAILDLGETLPGYSPILKILQRAIDCHKLRPREARMPEKATIYLLRATQSTYRFCLWHYLEIFTTFGVRSFRMIG